MEQTIQSKEFHFLTKGLRTIFTIIMTLMIVGLIMIAVLLGGAIFIPEEVVNDFLAKGNVSASLQFNGMEIKLAEQVAHHIRYVKNNFVLLLLATFAYLSILLLIVIQARTLLSSLHKGIIFSLANSKKMDWIAYSVLVLSLTVEAFRTYIAYTIGRFLELETLFASTEWVEHVSYHFAGINWTLLLCGFVIWTIARIFRYGAFLQEEYDATV